MIFEVFEPEITSDAARERIKNKLNARLKAGPEGETPANATAATP